MAFTDLREWLGRLDKDGELRRITAEVDWDRDMLDTMRRRGHRRLPRELQGDRLGTRARQPAFFAG